MWKCARNEVGGERVTGGREQIPFLSALQASPILVCFSWCPKAAGRNPTGTTRTWIKRWQTHITCSFPFGKRLFLTTQIFRSSAACLPLQTAIFCAAEKEQGLVHLKRHKCLILLGYYRKVKCLGKSDLTAQDVSSTTWRFLCSLQSIGIAGHMRNLRGKHSYKCISFPGRGQGGTGEHNEFWKDGGSPLWPFCPPFHFLVEIHCGCLTRSQTQTVQPFLLSLKSATWMFSPRVSELLEFTAICHGLSPWLMVEILLIRAEPGRPQEQWTARDRCCTHSWWLSVWFWEEPHWNLRGPWGTVCFDPGRGGGLRALCQRPCNLWRQQTSKTCS